MATAFVLLWIAVAPNGETLVTGSARFDNQQACETGRAFMEKAWLDLTLAAPKQDAGTNAWQARCVLAG